jgi:undecaprenyl-diphosphatase
VYTIAALAFLAALAFAVLSGRTEEFDNQIRWAVHARASAGLTAVFSFLTQFGEAGVLIALSAAVTALLLAIRWRREAAVFAVSMLGGFVVDLSLKLAFQRARPSESFFGAHLPSSSSFPSGHAFFSVCYFGTLVILLSPRLRSLPSKLAIWLAAGALALAIGFSRIYLGVHYATDVIGGYVAGAVWITAAVPFLRQYGACRRTNPLGSKSS